MSRAAVVSYRRAGMEGFEAEAGLVDWQGIAAMGPGVDGALCD